jgi:hypothetical protein
MNRKRIAVLIGLVIIFACGVLFLGAWHALRSGFVAQRAAALLEEELGMPVQMSGVVGLRVFPLPGVSFDDVRIGGEGDAGPSASVRQVRIVLEPWPLLSGDVVLRGCVIEGPRVVLGTGAAAVSNPAEGFRDRSEPGTAGVDLQKVRVVDGTLAWTARDGTTVHLESLSVAPEDDGRSRIRLAGTLTVAAGKGGPVLAEGAVQLSGEPHPVTRSVLERMRFSFAGRAGIAMAPLSVQGEGRIDVTEKTLEVSEVSVTRDDLELQGTVRVASEGRQWVLSLKELHLNGRQVAGEVTLVGPGSEPRLGIRCPTVDFAMWRDLLQKRESRSESPLFQGLLFELAHAGGSLDVTVDSLSGWEVPLADVHLTGSLGDGEVRMQGRANLPGGAARILLEGVACPEQMTGKGSIEILDAVGVPVFGMEPVFVLTPDKFGARFKIAPVSPASVLAVSEVGAVPAWWPDRIGATGTLQADASGVRLEFSELRADDLSLAGSATFAYGGVGWDLDFDFGGRELGGSFFGGMEGAASPGTESEKQGDRLLPAGLASLTLRNLFVDTFRMQKTVLTGTDKGQRVRFAVDGGIGKRPVRASGTAAVDPKGIGISASGRSEILPERVLKVDLSGIWQEKSNRFRTELLTWALEHEGAEQGNLAGKGRGMVDVRGKRVELESLSAVGPVLDCSGAVSLAWEKEPRLTGDVKVRSLKLVSLLEDWGLRLWPMSDPQVLNGLSGTTAISLNRKRIVFDTPGVALDPKSSASGKVTIRLDRPEIGLDLDANHLNLDRLLPDGSHGTGRRKKDGKRHRLVVDGSIRSDEVDWNRLRFTDVSCGLRSEGGSLVFSPLTATLYKGTLDGRIEADLRPDPSRLDVALKGTGVRLDPLMTRVTGNPKLAGRMNFSLDISGEPGGAKGYLAGVDGSGRMEIRQGGVVLEKGQAQPFERMRASGKIVKGRLTCSDFLAIFGRSTATGGGLVDLADRTVDGTFVVETPSVSPLASVPVLNRVKSLTDLSRLGWPSLTFHIKGSLMKPVVSLDREQLALDVGREVVSAPVTVGERVLDVGRDIVEFGGKAAGKVAETLGDLFGRGRKKVEDQRNRTGQEEQ